MARKPHNVAGGGFLLASPAALPARYAMTLTGDCVLPDLCDGTAVQLDSTAPFAAGDLVGIWFRHELIARGDPQMWVKRLVLPPPPWVRFPHDDGAAESPRAVLVVTANNPPRQLIIPCAYVLAVNKCLGPVPAGVELVHV